MGILFSAPKMSEWRVSSPCQDQDQRLSICRNKTSLVGGWATYPSEKWWSESQLWRILPIYYGKMKFMFQTTNQLVCSGKIIYEKQNSAWNSRSVLCSASNGHGFWRHNSLFGGFRFNPAQKILDTSNNHPKYSWKTLGLNLPTVVDKALSISDPPTTHHNTPQTRGENWRVGATSMQTFGGNGDGSFGEAATQHANASVGFACHFWFSNVPNSLM